MTKEELRRSKDDAHQKSLLKSSRTLEEFPCTSRFPRIAICVCAQSSHFRYTEVIFRTHFQGSDAFRAQSLSGTLIHNRLCFKDEDTLSSMTKPPQSVLAFTINDSRKQFTATWSPIFRGSLPFFSQGLGSLRGVALISVEPSLVATVTDLQGRGKGKAYYGAWS